MFYGGLPKDNDDEDGLHLLGSWTAFNKTVCEKESVKSLLKYLPANENPPEYPVCKEYLNFILDVIKFLNIPHIFVHVDEQVYARILHLIRKHEDIFSNVIPLMGGFHQLRVFQKIIYKRHNQERYSDAGVIAEGSSSQAFEGRHYFRSMRIHKEGFDALCQHRMENLTDDYRNIDETLLHNLKILRKTPSSEAVQQIMSSKEFLEFLSDFEATTDIRSTMTMQYLRDVSLMLTIVSAVREGHFDRHLEAERQFLKLVFAFDHVNYARYNTYHHVFLTNLKNTNHQACTDLTKYGFGCTRTEKERFSTKHGDIETEHFNRETKGTAVPFRSGYSTDIDAVNRWVKTSHIHTRLRKAVKKNFRLFTSSVHKEMTPSNKKRHYNHVHSLKKKLRDYNAKPFKPGPVRNIVSGKEIDEDIIKGLLGATEKCDERYQKFIQERLVTGNISFYSPIKKNNIRTGRELQKKTSKKVDILKVERQAFGVIISKCKSLDDAFSFPITSLPLSVGNPNGTLYQSDKAKFRNYIIGLPFDNKYHYDAMWIFDAGHAIRQVKPRDTYREYYTDLLKWILPEREARASSVVITTDDYRADSTKERERRSRRGGCEGRRVYVTGLEQKMPEGIKWSDFINNGQNKNDLMSLFGEFLKGDDAINIVNGIPLSFCGKESVEYFAPCNTGSAKMQSRGS